ncbi:MAG: hypothetical protein HFJ01_09380 [Lachnospiraceae bacterium]|nr:hypothetical protein [Lachnospiraceae bacterium]
MSKRTEELKIRISPEDKERIKLKMEAAGVLNMSAYIRKIALDGICIRLDFETEKGEDIVKKTENNTVPTFLLDAPPSGRMAWSGFLTPLEEALLQNRLPYPLLLEICQLLLDHGAEITEKYCEYFSNTCVGGIRSEMRILLRWNGLLIF